MARKDVLKGLLATPATQAPSPAPPRAQKGAIGAVSRSIADLKSRSVIELDPFVIDAGGVQDRLESVAADDDALARSIAEYGQQVPVLVRPHPEKDGRYQIVYGRRRVLALRDLGLPVKALVRDLDDRELILAQGQENTARRDLSFIEKVNFARQLQDAGYDRKVICDALSVDKTLASRMLSVAEKIPVALIEGIGAAPSVGRDRWLALADLIGQTGSDAETVLAMAALASPSERSDDRFAAAFDYLNGSADRTRSAEAAAGTAQSVPIYAADGLPLGKASRGPKYLTLKLRLAHTDGFEDWLLEAIPDLLRDWTNRKA